MLLTANSAAPDNIWSCADVIYNTVSLLKLCDLVTGILEQVLALFNDRKIE
jgi:hypothetical protein